MHLAIVRKSHSMKIGYSHQIHQIYFLYNRIEISFARLEACSGVDYHVLHNIF